MKECKYCGNQTMREAIMLPIRRMDAGTLYLLKDQTLPGRCIFASKHHVKRISDLSDLDFKRLSDDIYFTIRALTAVFSPDQINCLVLGDLADHLHIHIVPKYKNLPEWGKVFELDRTPPALLSDESYTERIRGINEALENCCEKS